jgi:hypothetical protein
MSNVFTAAVNGQKQFILPVTNLLPKNSLGGALANSATAQSWGTIIIPDAIKNNDYDYISFSALSSTTTGDSAVCVVNIEYLLPAEMANTISVLPNGTDIELTGGRYKVEIRPTNGMLLPIDIKSIHAISIPATGYSTYAAVTNITLWKTFFTSDANNSKTFLKDGLLYQGVNTYIVQAP